MTEIKQQLYKIKETQELPDGEKWHWVKWAGFFKREVVGDVLRTVLFELEENAIWDDEKKRLYVKEGSIGELDALLEPYRDDMVRIESEEKVKKLSEAFGKKNIKKEAEANN